MVIDDPITNAFMWLLIAFLIALPLWKLVSIIYKRIMRKLFIRHWRTIARSTNPYQLYKKQYAIHFAEEYRKHSKPIEILNILPRHIWMQIHEHRETINLESDEVTMNTLVGFGQSKEKDMALHVFLSEN